MISTHVHWLLLGGICPDDDGSSDGTAQVNFDMRDQLPITEK